MSGDSTPMPDFDDLLAAFDIPDVTVRIREATEEDEPSPGEGGSDPSEKNTSKDDLPSNNDSGKGDSSNDVQTSSVEGTASNTSTNDNQVTDKNTDGIQNSVGKTNQVKTVSESVPVSISKAGQVTITLSEEQIQKKAAAGAAAAKQPQKIILVTTPTTTTQGLGFKNTSSDGPKILNVSGGVSNLVQIPSSVSGGKPVLLQKIVSASGNIPAVYRAGSVRTINSNQVSSGHNSSLPVFRLTGSRSVTKPSTSVTLSVTKVDPVEVAIKQLSGKQLTRKNPIETYTMTPPPEDLGLDIPIGGYSCKECGDSYALEVSLRRHMERRSVKILINCNCCGYKREFYNKCSMHAHLRGHNIMNLNTTIDAVVSPLDAISPSGPGRPKVNGIKPSSGLEDQKPSGPVIKVKDLLQQARQKLSDKLPKPPQSGMPNRKLETSDPNKCPACLRKLTELVDRKVEEPLKYHLQSRLDEDQQHTCLHCGLILGNFCQLLIHNQIHHQSSHQAPWICPECGMKFTKIGSFLKHINLMCVHFNRNAVFSCKLCGKMCIHSKVCVARPLYLPHLSQVHKNSFYKCLNCHTAFRNVESLKIHSRTEHSNFASSPLCSLISKCPLCDTVFTRNSMLQSHIETHINAFPPVGFKFGCVECPFRSDSIIGLKVHQGSVHSQRNWWFCDICLNKFPTVVAMANHRRKAHSYITPNNASLTDVTHESTLSNGATPISANAVSPQGNNEKKTEHLPNGKVGEQKINEDRKESTKVIIKRMLRCPGCKALGVDLYFKKEKNLRHHISRNHSHMDPNSIRPEFLEYVPFYPGKGNSKVHDQNEGGGNDVMVGHKRKRTHESEATAKRIRKLKEDKLSCGKCDFETKDRIMFSSHIEEHCDGNVSQCQECGVCFRVVDSLNKHLFIKHQIRDMTSYKKFQREVTESIEKYKAAKMEEMKELDKGSEGSPVNPLECNVCHRVFDTEVLKKNHMRSHGMAFITAKNKAT